MLDAPPDQPPAAVAPPNAVTGAGSIELSEAEREKVQLVRDLFYRARDARRPMMAQWRRNYRTLNLSQRNFNNGSSDGRIPQIWPVCASMVAWMTDQRPILETMASGQAFSPHHDTYTQLASDMNALLHAAHMEYQEDVEHSRMLWDVITYGIGWERTIWDNTLADGLGDTTVRRLDPFTVYPDPHAQSPKDMDHIIEAKMMTVSAMDRAWPGAAKRLGYAGHLEDVDEAPHKLDGSISSSMPRALIGRLDGNSSSVITRTNRVGPGMQNRTDDVVTVLECWVRSHDVTDTDVPGVKRVRDVWRVYVVAGNRLLFEGKADEVSAFNTHPYDRCVLFDTGEMYGPCLVEFMAGPQESINRIVKSIEDNTILMGNPILAESPRSQSRHQRKSNQPGTILRATPNDVGWLAPPQMHPQQSVALLQYFESKIESISGMSAIVRGFQPSGRNAQGVLDSVQDAAFVRIRATLRELERTLRGVTTKKCAFIAEFYTEPRMVAMIGQDGQRLRRALRGRHFYSMDRDRLPLRFTIIADAGSQLLTSKQARAAEADTLFGLGAIDELEVLKAHQWPNYAHVAKRIMERAVQGVPAGPSQRQAARA